MQELFKMNDYGDIWQEPDLFDAPQTCATSDDFAHTPGVVFAPVFGLPGPRSSVCQTCGRAITRRTTAEAWRVA